MLLWSRQRLPWMPQNWTTADYDATTKVPDPALLSVGKASRGTHLQTARGGFGQTITDAPRRSCTDGKVECYVIGLHAYSVSVTIGIR